MTRVTWRPRRPSAAARLPSGRASSEDRTVWIRLLGLAGGVSADTGNPVIFEIRHDISALSGKPFPVDGESPQHAARGFLELGRAFCIAATPERRSLLAPALRAAAKALDDLITETRTSAAAATWWGKRDD